MARMGRAVGSVLLDGEGWGDTRVPALEYAGQMFHLLAICGSTHIGKHSRNCQHHSFEFLRQGQEATRSAGRSIRGKVCRGEMTDPDRPCGASGRPHAPGDHSRGASSWLHHATPITPKNVMNSLLHGHDGQCRLTLIICVSTVPNMLSRCCSSGFVPLWRSGTIGNKPEKFNESARGKEGEDEYSL